MQMKFNRSGSSVSLIEAIDVSRGLRLLAQIKLSTKGRFIPEHARPMYSPKFVLIFSILLLSYSSSSVSSPWKDQGVWYPLVPRLVRYFVLGGITAALTSQPPCLFRHEKICETTAQSNGVIWRLDQIQRCFTAFGSVPPQTQSMQVTTFNIFNMANQANWHRYFRLFQFHCPDMVNAQSPTIVHILGT